MFTFQVTLMSNNLVDHLSSGAKVHRIMKFYTDPTLVFNIMGDELKEMLKDLDNPFNFLSFLRGLAPGLWEAILVCVSGFCNVS